MANRFPLIVDTSDGNKIKEIEVGDNLNLQGSGLVNASSITVNGVLSAQSITVNGTELASVATTGSYSDLSNTPVLFSGSYNDLTNKPSIPASTRQLSDVQNIEPSNGDVLIYDSNSGNYVPGTIDVDANINNSNLADLANVITSGDTSNKFLKYYSGAWRAANVTYAEIQNTPTLLSEFTDDVGYLTSASLENVFAGGGIFATDIQGSVFADDSTLLVDGVNGSFYGYLTGDVDGDVKGSVFADDSTLLVDGVNGEIPGYVKIADLKTALQDGAGDYDAFKAWVLANL